MADIVTYTVQTFFLENKIKNTTSDNNSTDFSGATDMFLNAGGDETLLTYIDVVRESLQRPSELLSTLLEKTETLMLS